MMIKTRMHFNRMRTDRSGRLGVGWGVCARGARIGPRGRHPPNRITDRCQNITFPQPLLRTVKINCWLYLPPVTKLGQGNIFRSACQEFCPQGGGAWQGSMCGKGGMCGRGHAWRGGGWSCVARGGGVRGIRSMSGRYASYWNAFLFQLPSDTGCSSGESLLFLLVVSPLSLKCQRNTL